VASRKVIIAIIGLPSSGKTMLGNYLKSSGYYVLPEVAGLLLSRGLTAGERADSDFDRKVMSMEFARDYRFLRSNRGVQVVETWHIGNMAYSMARFSPTMYKYESKFSNTLQKFEAKCLFLDIDPYTSYLRSLKLRKPTSNSINFLDRVQEHMRTLIDDFRLVSVALDATKSSKDILGRALDVVSSWAASENI